MEEIRATLAWMGQAGTTAERVHFLARAFGIEESELLNALEASTVSASERIKKRQLDALVRAYSSLRKILPDDSIKKWMRQPVRRLEGHSPRDLLGERGAESFCALVLEFLDGAYA